MTKKNNFAHQITPEGDIKETCNPEFVRGHQHVNDTKRGFSYLISWLHDHKIAL